MPLGSTAPFAMSIPNLLGGFSRPPTVALEPGFFVSLHQREQTRIKRYTEYWRAYNGLPDLTCVNPEDPINSWNYIRRFIDVGVFFLVGAGFTIKVPKPLVGRTLPFLTDVWKANDRDGFAYNVAITGAVTGDWFAMVAHQAPTPLERQIRPYSKGEVRFKRFGSEQVFPVWDSLDMDRMIGVRIETYYYDMTNGMNPAGGPLPMQRHTMTISREMIVTQVHDGQPVFKRNALGEIPVVHCKNLPLPGEYFGLSDVQDLIGPVKDMNEKTTDISNAINYNGTPTLALFGAKAKDLPKGNNTFWSGLPEKAHFEVLRMHMEDIGAATQYVEIIKKTIHELSSVPEAALGGSMAISNTSGVALNLIFQPMIQRRTVKRAFYEPAFERLNYFALRIGALEGLVELPFDLCTCGGRIVEVETGREIETWDPNLATFVKTPERRKKCFRVDPQTLQFQDPKDVVVKTMMNYGAGSHVGDLPFEETKKSAKEGKKSFWAQGTKSMKADDGTPEPTIPLTEFPREPETVTVITQYVSPETGLVVKERREDMVLIPTECVVPQYVNPYETDVDFNEVLPKDDAMKANWLTIAQTGGWVDAEYCQDQFPEIAAAKNEINARMLRAKANEKQETDQQQQKQFHQELAAKDQSASSVKGKADKGDTQ